MGSPEVERADCLIHRDRGCVALHPTALLCRSPSQFAGVAHMHVEGDRIEIEAVGPGRRAHLDEHAREICRIAQRHEHRSVGSKDMRTVADALGAVGKPKLQSMPL
jgi:hypothetical protein